jgi:Zn finger protein HypA/HybF involved in hydrogenase expression
MSRNQLITVIVAVLVIAGSASFVVYRQWTSESREAALSTPEDTVTVCRCTHCGNTFGRKTVQLLERHELDPLEHSTLRGEARKCPQCGQYAVVVIDEKRPGEEDTP